MRWSVLLKMSSTKCQLCTLFSAAKLCLLFINILLIIFGLICIFFGISILINVQLVFPWFELANNDLNLTPYSVEGIATILLLLIGGLMLTLGIFGFVAAVFENRCLILINFLLLLTLLLVLVAFATLMYSQGIAEFREPLLRSLKRYDLAAPNVTNMNITKAWDDVQQKFRCCGVDSYKDWTDVSDLVRFKSTAAAAAAATASATAAAANGSSSASSNYYKVPRSCCEYIAPSDTNEHYNVITWTNCYASVRDEREISTGGRKYFSGCYTKLQFSLNKYKNITEVTNWIVTTVIFVDVLIVFLLSLGLKSRHDPRSGGAHNNNNNNSCQPNIPPAPSPAPRQTAATAGGGHGGGNNCRDRQQQHLQHQSRVVAPPPCPPPLLPPSILNPAGLTSQQQMYN